MEALLRLLGLSLPMVGDVFGRVDVEDLLNLNLNLVGWTFLRAYLSVVLISPLPVQVQSERTWEVQNCKFPFDDNYSIIINCNACHTMPVLSAKSCNTFSASDKSIHP